MTKEEKKEPILVNGEAVSEALIEQELHQLRNRYSAEMSYQELDEKQAKIASDARENAVERVLLMQQARKEIEGLRPEEIEARFAALKHQHGGEELFAKRYDLKEEDVAEIKAEIEDGLRLEKYFDELCRNAERPGEADARAYYEAHRAEFTTPEMVHAAHIVQQPSEESPLEKIYAGLLNIRERLIAGEDFETLATEYTHCQDGSSDLGYFTRGQMVQSFEDTAFSTPVGEYSDVFQSEFGYHILKVLDRREGAVREFDEVRYDIESMLYEARKNEVIGAEADRLRAEADIQNLVIAE